MIKPASNKTEIEAESDMGKMEAESWLNWADRVYFGFAIIAAVATAITVVAGIAQNRLNAYISADKDRRLIIYQKDAAAKIAEANNSASIADLKAAEANEIAQKSVLKTELLKHRNLELQQALSPRELEQFKSATALRFFARMKYAIFSVPDFESRRLVGQMNVMFDMAGWQRVDLAAPSADAIQDGVSVHYVTGWDWQTRTEVGEDRKIAATELIRQLSANKIAASDRWIPFRYAQEMHIDAALDTITIYVGLKPTPEFSNDDPSPKSGIDIRGNR